MSDYLRDWSSLPLDILRDISSRTTIFDRYSFANVCTSWRSAKAPLSPQMPFVFLHNNYFSPKPFCMLLNPARNLSDDVRMPILGGKVCIGSQYGWLILVDNTVTVISLYNPLSHQEIKLPSHADGFLSKRLSVVSSYFLSRWFSLQKVVLSCPPISSTGRFHAAVALLEDGDFLYKRDGDYNWKLSSHNFQDITSWRGKFVGITWCGYVYKIDLDMPEPKFECMDLGALDRLTFDQYNKHLVSLDDNLLQVWWYIDSLRIMTVKVLQLNLQPNTHFNNLWIPVDDLCDHSLFLSTSHSFSLSSKHIPGLKDNLIYFIHDKRYNHSNRDIGVFDMKSGTYEICPLPNTPFSSSTSAFWYAPPLSELRNQSL